MSLSVVFVLVGTSHPGNIGAAARAMKTMGFETLRLVDACDHLDKESLVRSSGAENVLWNASVFPTLGTAVADCHVVVGTSARRREISVPILAAREVGEEFAGLAARATAAGETLRAAVLFGQERSGLDNDALDLCTRQLRIPCNPAFSSLNLGSAVQVVAYELSQALARVPSTPPEGPLKAEHLPATGEAMEHFFAHLDRVMVSTGFLDPARPRQLRRRVRRYFERSRPSVNELSILRGVLAAAEGARRGPGEVRSVSARAPDAEPRPDVGAAPRPPREQPSREPPSGSPPEPPPEPTV